MFALKNWRVTWRRCCAARKALSRWLAAATQQLRERARMFFAALPMAGDGRQPFTEREEFLETSGDLYMACARRCSRMEAEMERVTGVDEAPGLKKRVARLRDGTESS